MNYRSYKNGKSEIFSRMLVKTKLFRELFTSTRNGIAVSVRYVSSMPVVLDDRLHNAHRIKLCETKKHEDSDAISEASHRHSVASVPCSVCIAIIYITMHKQKAPIYKLSSSKAPKRSQLTNIREKTVDFFMVHHGCWF